MSESIPVVSPVSVVIPVYNGERYLVSAIESIRQQTLGDWELIAVDDGSTDTSRALLESLALTDPRLRVLSRSNTGIVGALSRAGQRLSKRNAPT